MTRLLLVMLLKDIIIQGTWDIIQKLYNLMFKKRKLILVLMELVSWSLLHWQLVQYFDITSTMTQMLNMKGLFGGASRDHSNLHLINFLDIFKTYRLLQVRQNVIRLLNE
ncbi:hypothetical protein KY284_010983 [Solanum tuberosum]|nr:hypothetical protein KY284_010983 [Solanum tuberosum]